MRILPLMLALVVVAAGCIQAETSEPAAQNALDASAVAFALPGGGTLESVGAKADASTLRLVGVEGSVTFPAGVLLWGDDGRFTVPAGAITLVDGASIRYIPPYGAENLTVVLETAAGKETLVLPLDGGAALYSGERAVELLKVQRDQFPHRSPGMPSYDLSMDYFAEFFKGLGMATTVDRYNSPAVPVRDISAGSFSTVVAMKKGTSSPERFLIFGGHFDVVEETRDGAFDNTAGTVAVMALAEAFVNVTTDHTLVFALWGGEEDGILGSQGWISRNPQLVPFIDGYFNYDVTALAWPAPKIDPAPIVIAAGPDGPIANALHANAKMIQDTYMGVGATWVHETVVGGQATGAGVNAQSDHTPFAMRGIPVYFQFTARVNDVFAIIHSDTDTVENLTRYSLGGVEAMLDTAAPLTPEEEAEGEWYLARSFETQLAMGFYWVALIEAGVLNQPAAAPVAAALPALPI